MKHLLAFFFLVTLTAFATSVPDNVREAVEQVRKSDQTPPRQSYFALIEFTPKTDAEQRVALATLLAQAINAPDTTPLGRTILCQRLALVAGPAEMPLVTKWLGQPGAPTGKVESKEVYLAEANDTQPAKRVAGLSSLARFYPKDSGPVLVKAMSDADPVVSATAIQLAGKLDGAALAAQLLKLDTSRQVLALGVLAEHKVAAARGAIDDLLSSRDEQVRTAAISALGALGDASSVPVLAKAGAEGALAQLVGPGVDEAILKALGDAGTDGRPTLINAAVARGATGLTPVLLKAARDADKPVRNAALKALGRSGDTAAYPQLVAMLAVTPSPELETAVGLMGRRLSTTAERLTPLLALLKRDGLTVESQGAVMRRLALIGGTEAIVPVRERLAATEAKLHDAAVRALCAWADAPAIPDLAKIVADSVAAEVHRTLAKEAVTRLAKKVLIVTGLDYPGHKWKETTPVLQAAIAQDIRLDVTVTEDPKVLGSPDLKKYDVIVLHYMNWQDPGPGAAAQENLRKTIEAGTGLVMVHFACGAFQGWKEFAKIAGRVWNPKLRGHDPHGAFRVNLTDRTHPITAGLESFDTTDELYTCLTGDTPVHELANATSKVDKKGNPMAFVLNYGKGRVFQCMLGHDVKALSVPAVGELYCRATAWAAELEPASKTK